MSDPLPAPDLQDVLQRYLDAARDALVWKLDGLSEYDARRPLTPTGTNLLGLVKHVASVELGYFGECMGRPSGVALPWFDDDAEPNADMWAEPHETRDQILDLCATARAHTHATIRELGLDATGHVPWWGEHGTVTLQQLLVHMIAETHRHAGQADIVRELIDGAAGYRPDNDNLPDESAEWWQGYRERVETAARAASEPGRAHSGETVTHE
jgi:uncharacterized damage-inducible protein DinB